MSTTNTTTNDRFATTLEDLTTLGFQAVIQNRQGVVFASSAFANETYTDNDLPVIFGEVEAGQPRSRWTTVAGDALTDEELVDVATQFEGENWAVRVLAEGFLSIEDVENPVDLF